MLYLLFEVDSGIFDCARTWDILKRDDKKHFRLKYNPFFVSMKHTFNIIYFFFLSGWNTSSYFILHIKWIWSYLLFFIIWKVTLSFLCNFRISYIVTELLSCNFILSNTSQYWRLNNDFSLSKFIGVKLHSHALWKVIY